MGTDFSLHFQGLSNPSSSECNIYLGNYEKSYNNVLFTAFIISLLGSECRLPPNHNQRRAWPSGSQSQRLLPAAPECQRWALGGHRGKEASRAPWPEGNEMVLLATSALSPAGGPERRRNLGSTKSCLLFHISFYLILLIGWLVEGKGWK